MPEGAEASDSRRRGANSMLGGIKVRNPCRLHNARPLLAHLPSFVLRAADH